MPEKIDYVEDWAQRLRGRLYAQFRNAETWQQWCDEVLGPQFQDLEDATQTILSLLDIDGSEGVQLDLIGRYVGQSRLGADDPTYRIYLKARIEANRSTGTVENIYDVFRALFGEAAGLHYLGGWVKQFAVQVDTPITRALALIGVEFLTAAKEGGARGILEWVEYGVTQTFAFYNGPHLATGIEAGAFIQRVFVDRTDGTPTLNGFLRIQDINTQFFYSSRTATCFHSAIGATMIYAHPVGAPVNRLHNGLGNMGFSAGQSGAGFDQGRFAGAKQA